MENLYRNILITTVKIRDSLSEKIKIEDLTPKETITLLFIVRRSECTKHKEEINVKTIQEFFKTKVSSVVQILNKLEDKNLIMRVTSKIDKRISIIVPTERAKKLVDLFYYKSEELLLSLVDSNEEINSALNTLNELTNRLVSKENLIIRLEEGKNE